jgi:hypothetical protein
MHDISWLLRKSAPHGKAVGTESWCTRVWTILLPTNPCLLLLWVGNTLNKQKEENKAVRYWSDNLRCHKCCQLQ